MEAGKEYPLISVIMPVYNGENYIKKSINSVCMQTYPNVELVVVNDGSKDKSMELLTQMQKEMADQIAIRIFEQENAGICMARNKALQEIQGEFFCFIDQDDFMRPDCLEELYREQEKSDADVVIGGFDLVDSKDNILENWELNPENPWSKYRITAPWGRLFRTEIMKKNQIEFMIIKISEDFYFNMLYFSYCKKISVTRYKGYCWLYSENSESHANMSRLSQDRNPLEMLTKLHATMNQPNILEPAYVEYMVLKYMVWYLLYVVKGTNKQDFQAVYQNCFDWMKTYYPSYVKNPLIRFGKPVGESFKIRFIVKVSMILQKLHLFYPFLRVYSKI